VPCGAWKAGLVWGGVRLGGWIAWDGKQPHGPPPERPAKPDADDGEVIGIWTRNGGTWRAVRM